MSTFEFSTRSLLRLQGVDEELYKLMKLALSRSPIDFGIPEFGGLRTVEDQKKLFDKGLSKADGTIKKSYHQTGNAVDVFAFVNGKASWDEVHLSLIAGVVLSCAKELNLNVTWGGTFGSKEFKGWDMPHFQIELK
jgi:peptidoglycan LD-endopeptidase CwlK